MVKMKNKPSSKEPLMWVKGSLILGTDYRKGTQEVCKSEA